MQLLFKDAEFDAVCQFGVMFFPINPRLSQKLAECSKEGALLFNVWDRIEENEFAQVVSAVIESFSPEDSPRFMTRTPHGYYDQATIAKDLQCGGFASPLIIHTVTERSQAESSGITELVYCQGTCSVMK